MRGARRTGRSTPTASPRRAARRRAAAVALALIASGGLAACDAPSSAADVGGVAISDDQVSARTSAFLSESVDPSTPTTIDDSIRLNRVEVTSLIRHELLARAASAAGVSVTEQQVSTALQTQSTVPSVSRAPAADARDAVRDYLLLEALLAKQSGQQFEADQVDISVDIVLRASKSEAIASRMRYQADPAALHADAVAQSVAGQSQTDVPLSSVAQASSGPLGLFDAPVGTMTVVAAQNGWYVVGVAKRTTSRQAVAVSDVLGTSDPATVLSTGALVLAPTAAAAGVTVNPRYGVWDPTTLQVAAPSGGL